MSKAINVPVELMRDSVNIVSEAAALCEKVAADQAVLEIKAPQVADTLIENGLVDSLDKEAVVKLLQDPSATLDIVTKLSKQASSPRSMGSAQRTGAEPEGYNPQFPLEKESDRIFTEKLGSIPVA